MAFKPLHDRVLVRRIQGEDKTKGGLFGKWSGTEVTLNGEVLLIMKESDILGIIS